MSSLTSVFAYTLKNGYIPVVQTVKNNTLSSAFVAEMAKYGYLVDYTQAASIPTQDMKDILTAARSVSLSDKDMVPFYPNFPEQVQQMDIVDLLVDQIMHYMTQGTYTYRLIAGEDNRRAMELKDMIVQGTPVSIGGMELVENTIRTMVCGSSALSESQTEGLAVLTKFHIEHTQSDSVAIDSMMDATNNENAAVMFNILVSREKSLASRAQRTPDVSRYVSMMVNKGEKLKNTDVILRAMLMGYSYPVNIFHEAEYQEAVSNLNDNYARTVRMSNAPKSVKKSVMKALDTCLSSYHETGDFSGDKLVAHRVLWRTVANMIHGYDFVKEHSAGHLALDIIYDNVNYQTLNSVVEMNLNSGNVDNVVEMLMEHAPGNLLRRVVALARRTHTNKESKVLVDAIRTVGKNSTLSTLIGAYNGVRNANYDHPRIIRTKNAVKQINTSREPIGEDIQNALCSAIEDSMLAILSTMDAPVSPVGATDATPVALSQRHDSDSSYSILRGETLDIDNTATTLRLFTHWFNSDHEGSVDIDLSGIGMDADFNTVDVCTWNSYGDARQWSTYSGDIVNAPRPTGATEYVDIYIDGARKEGIKYVALGVTSYSGQKIADVDVVAGVMPLVDAQAGDVFEPRNCLINAQLSTQSTKCAVLMVDVDDLTMTWIDSTTGSLGAGTSEAGYNMVPVATLNEVARYTSTCELFTYGHLAKLYAQAHNVGVTSDVADRELLSALVTR